MVASTLIVYLQLCEYYIHLQMRKYTIDYPELVAYSQIMSQLANQVYQSDTPDVTAGAT